VAAEVGLLPDLAPTLQVLATRWQRLGAYLLDQVALGLTLIPFAAMYSSQMQAAAPPAARSLTLMPLVVPLLLPFALSALQWYLIASSGQSVGKKLVGIKIVLLDGAAVGFVRGVVLRIWVLGMASVIPYVGTTTGLIDALWIFGAERRCLHDLVAGTKVIDARLLRAA